MAARAGQGDTVQWASGQTALKLCRGDCGGEARQVKSLGRQGIMTRCQYLSGEQAEERAPGRGTALREEARKKLMMYLKTSKANSQLEGRDFEGRDKGSKSVWSQRVMIARA